MTAIGTTSLAAGRWGAVLGALTRLAGVVLIALISLGCPDRSKPKQLVARAQFGIFFGGQVQERKKIPFVLDRSKQKHGIRIEFAEPLREKTHVSWEVDMPGEGRRVRDDKGRIGKGRVVKLSEAEVPAGRQVFEQVLPFSPGDPLGMWNIRVVVEDSVVIDRPFLVLSEERR